MVRRRLSNVATTGDPAPSPTLAPHRARQAPSASNSPAMHGAIALTRTPMP